MISPCICVQNNDVDLVRGVYCSGQAPCNAFRRSDLYSKQNQLGFRVFTNRWALKEEL